MREQIQRLLIPSFACILLTLCTWHTVCAQHTIIVSNPDTIYVIRKAVLDSVFVTPKKNLPPIRDTWVSLWQNTSLQGFISGSELSTGVSGVTHNLQRDLPAMIRLYTPEGIPMLTKYTSNHALTSAIPDSAVQYELKEPSAKYPNPDAPVIIQPNYSLQSGITLSPLEQSLGISTGTGRSVAAMMSLAHSGAPKKFQEWIPELRAYNTTNAAYGAIMAELPHSQAELIVHHSQSDNEYGGLLGIEHLRESDRGTHVFLNTRYSLGQQALHAGVAYQNGSDRKYVEELGHSYGVINEIRAITYTAAISRNNTTEFRINYHDLNRIYTYGREDSVHMQRLVTVLTHKQRLSPEVQLSLQARFDHKDNKPSVSTEFTLQPDQRLRFILNAAHLYDAVGSEALNSLMNSVQINPHPWTTTYARIGSEYRHRNTRVSASITNKTVHRGWYGQSATISGWITRIRARGMLLNPLPEGSYLAWQLGGTARFLALETPQQYYETMPGPARLAGHASLELDTGSMTYTIQADAFIERQMRARQYVYADLGAQYFISFGISKRYDFLQIGAELNNALTILGQDNKIVAHYNEVDGMSYVIAPPIINLSIGISF